MLTNNVIKERVRHIYSTSTFQWYKQRVFAKSINYRHNTFKTLNIW